MVADRFVTFNPQGREIRLSEACYGEHILVEHPDMSNDHEIEETIRHAKIIAEDTIDELRRVYYRTYRRIPRRYSKSSLLVTKWRQQGTSHVVFTRLDENTLPIPGKGRDCR